MSLYEPRPSGSDLRGLDRFLTVAARRPPCSLLDSQEFIAQSDHDLSSCELSYYAVNTPG